MNCSAEALEQFLTDKIIVNFNIENLIVIHDDLDLETGRIKLKFNSGSGGHRGVSSLINFLGEKRFFRIKIGIGRPSNGNITNYVLSKFNKEEINKIKESIRIAANYSVLLGLHKNISEVSNLIKFH